MDEHILAGIFSTPYTRSLAAARAERERYQAQARAIGVAPDTIARMTAIAQQVGPRTLLPNDEVWRAVWQTILSYAKQGRPPIPGDCRQWAADIWLVLYYTPPAPAQYGAFLSLVDALLLLTPPR